ncbi:MAG: rhodanese-like domain-containing protein [Gammaproteobacteria bacterium]|nr:rhodanese-like domain-containing protein [Gammaproteobacteria bacterium]
MEQLLEFISNHPLLVTAAVVTGTLLIYNEVRAAGQGRFNISPDQAVRLMNSGAAVFDVRSPEAYMTGHLAGAKNLPVDDIAAQAESYKRFRNKPVIAYCEKTMSSQRAVARLRQAGFEQVFNLRGGLAAWREEHLPLQKPKGKS